MLAAMHGNVRMVKLLIKWGADLEMVTVNGYTALHFAAMEAQDDAVEVLLHAGAKIEAKDKQGRTTLMNALFSKRSSIDTIELLLDSGASLEARDNDGSA